LKHFLNSPSATVEEYLNERGRDFVETHRTYSIRSIGKDLLCKILGFVDLKDIRIVAVTCKYLNHLFNNSAQFWQPFVERRLRGFPVVTQNASMFKDHSSSLKQAFQWLSCKMPPLKLDCNRYVIDVGAGVQVTLYPDGSRVANLTYPKNGDHRISERYVFDHPSLKYYLMENKAEKILEIRSEQDGFKFVGKSNYVPEMKNYRGIVPHGAGRWTFPDGSTFSGPNVACEGFPHGFGTWKHGEAEEKKVEFEFGHRVTPTYKRRKIKW
jgi:hypothetical protein